MDCHGYIDNYLSADVDGELSGEERPLADQHLAGCENCRAVLAAERSLKALVQSELGIAKTPPEVRERILQALGREAEGAGASTGRLPMPRWIGWSAPLAIAAVALLVVVAVIRQRGVQVAEPALDWAIGRFDDSEKSFSPTAPGNSPAALADYLRSNVDLPTHVWDFDRVGFSLIGGRIEQTDDKGTVVHTLYRGPHGDILCNRYRAGTTRVPPGDCQLRGIHHFYDYKGHSICLTIENQVCCILVSRLPLAELYQTIDRSES